jgi:hypothetical protein
MLCTRSNTAKLDCAHMPTLSPQPSSRSPGGSPDESSDAAVRSWPALLIPSLVGCGRSATDMRAGFNSGAAKAQTVRHGTTFFVTLNVGPTRKRSAVNSAEALPGDIEAMKALLHKRDGRIDAFGMWSILRESSPEARPNSNTFGC